MNTIKTHKTECLAFFTRQLSHSCAVLFVLGNSQSIPPELAYHSRNFASI